MCVRDEIVIVIYKVMDRMVDLDLSAMMMIITVTAQIIM
jgi:hypothetical protein